MIGILLALLSSAPVATPGVKLAAPASASDPRSAVECVMTAWNAYDVEASRKCYADSPVARNAHGVVPIDWDFERGLRAFDRVARSRFTAEIVKADATSVEYRLRETNDLVTALGLEGVTALWRYVVREGRITEEELMDADGAFRSRLRKMAEWGRASKPAGWESVVDSEGVVRFDGSTASTLIRLAKDFSATR